MENPQYLVIGTAITETITHLEDGKSRQDVGAVAGQMATALSRHQCDVTLLTSTGQDEQGKKTLERLTEAGVKTYTVTHTSKTGWASISTRAGEQARTQGAWPTLDEIASELAGNLRDIDWILVDCNLSATALNRILGMAAKEQIPVTINATTKGKSRLIWETRTHPKRLATMNRDEQLNLMRLSEFENRPGTQRKPQLPQRIRQLRTAGLESRRSQRHPRQLASHPHTDGYRLHRMRRLRNCRADPRHKRRTTLSLKP